MICPNCKRDTKIETTRAVLRYHNKYMEEIPVTRWGMWCTACGHSFHTPAQKEIYLRERGRLIRESEERK